MPRDLFSTRKIKKVPTFENPPSFDELRQDGYTYSEIAEIHNCDPQRVKKYFKRKREAANV